MSDCVNVVSQRQKRRRAILVVSAILLLSITAYAQREPQNQNGSRAKKPSLKVKLIALTPTACLGSPLKLRLEVTNVGQETVKLNRAYFWNNYSVHPAVPKAEDKDKEYFLAHVWPRSTSEDVIFLAPDELYVSHRYWSLDEEGSKLGPGLYTLEIGTYGYGSEVQFELHDCASEKIKE